MKRLLALTLIVLTGCSTAQKKLGEDVANVVVKDAETVAIQVAKDEIEAKTGANVDNIPATVKELESTVVETYVVKKHDCLWTIAKARYGDPFEWPVIYFANEVQIGSQENSPNFISTSSSLVIPKNPSSISILTAHEFAKAYKK